MSSSRFLPRLTLLVAGCACLMLSGCGAAVVETTRVSGVVKINGKPLEIGVIGFEPESPSDPSATSEIRDGKFAIDSPRGLRRISIMAYRQAKGLGPDGKPYKEQYLPAKFNLESDRTLEVDSDPIVDHEIDLKVTE